MKHSTILIINPLLIRKFLIVILTVLCIDLIAQTPVEVLEKYSSTIEYQSVDNDISKVIEENYKLEENEFIKLLGKNLKQSHCHSNYLKNYPEIALIEVRLNNSTIDINVLNQIDTCYVNEIKRVFNLTSNYWKKNRNAEFNFVIQFIPDGEFKRLDGFDYVEDSLCLQVILEIMDGYKFVDEPKCYYMSPAEMYNLSLGLLNKNETSASLYFIKTLCRWFPFNKKYHELYYEIIETNANKTWH